MGLSNTDNQESVRGVSNLQIGMDDTPDKNINIEDLLKSKNSKIPSGQTGDTAYFTATSAEIKDVKRKMRRTEIKTSPIPKGALITLITYAIAFCINLSCSCSGPYACTDAWCKFLILVFSVPLLLTGIITIIIGIVMATRLLPTTFRIISGISSVVGTLIMGWAMIASIASGITAAQIPFSIATILFLITITSLIFWRKNKNR